MYKTNMLISCSIAFFTCLAFSFSGCIADRNFTPGVSVHDNIVEAIHSSYKVILVLTDHFVLSQWCKYEADQALESKEDNCIIPVLLGECELPEKIAHLNYINLANDQDVSRQMRRLKTELLPGDSTKASGKS